MTNGKIHVGDCPTFRDIIKDQDGVIVDISSATIEMIFRKPDNTAVKKTASLTGDGTDGEMEYTCTTSDLDGPGQWQRQSKVQIGSDVWKTVKDRFWVYEALPEA